MSNQGEASQLKSLAAGKNTKKFKKLWNTGAIYWTTHALETRFPHPKQMSLLSPPTSSVFSIETKFNHLIPLS